MNEVLQSFPTTQWSAVLAAEGAPVRAHKALLRLAETYWYPVYALIRDTTNHAASAEYLTKTFFFSLLTRSFPGAVQPDRCFRSFLRDLVCCYLAEEGQRALVQSQDSGTPSLTLDFACADRRYRLESLVGNLPASRFEWRWAQIAFEGVVEKLRGEYAATGRAIQFEAFRQHLATDTLPAIDDIAADLDMTAAAALQAVERARRRFGRLLLEEVAQTVHAAAVNPQDWESEVAREVRYLTRILRVSSGNSP